eukprot:Skav217362  [mRNA]  locus=scaffold3931:54691:56983:- [translate_table: standard]
MQKAVILSPEFNTMGNSYPIGPRPPAPPKPEKEPQDYKALVMVFLNGGADTYNMLVPLNCPLYDEYRDIRQNVALDGNTLHQITATGQPCSEFGIHPELNVFKTLYDSNELAFAANVGCVGLFSHSDQQRAAQTLTCQYPSIANKGAGFDTTAQILTDGEPIGVEKEYNQQVSAALDFNAKLRKSLRNAELKTSFYVDRKDITAQLKEVARAERGVDRDLFFVQMGGFDNHEKVGSELPKLFDSLNHGFYRFMTELKAQNLFDSVVMVTHSDFARTLTPNSNSGTDHAWAGNYVIAGGSINGGKIFNEFPRSLLPGGEQDVGRGRLIPKFPFENFMLPIAKWMGLEEGQFQKVFPNIGNFNSSSFIDQTALFK